MTLCIAGIDCGITGGLAFYFPSRPDLISVEDIPAAGGVIDAVTLAQRLEQLKPDFCIIEAVGAMPGQGVSSTFKFGVTYGIIRGVVLTCRVPTYLVTPGKWKRYYNLSADKDEARAAAISFWPSSTHFARKKDHNRAEAALLARYGAEVIARKIAGDAA